MDNSNAENTHHCNSKRDKKMSFGILEDKISDLEHDLAQLRKNIKYKECLVKLQAEQLRKMEEMQKKTLEENKQLSYAKRKAQHEIKNLRTIIKGHEERKQNIRNACTETEIESTSNSKSSIEASLKQHEITLGAIFALCVYSAHAQEKVNLEAVKQEILSLKEKLSHHGKKLSCIESFDCTEIVKCSNDSSFNSENSENSRLMHSSVICGYSCEIDKNENVRKIRSCSLKGDSSKNVRCSQKVDNSAKVNSCSKKDDFHDSVSKCYKLETENIYAKNSSCKADSSDASRTCLKSFIPVVKSESDNNVNVIIQNVCIVDESNNKSMKKSGPNIYTKKSCSTNDIKNVSKEMFITSCMPDDSTAAIQETRVFEQKISAPDELIECRGKSSSEELNEIYQSFCKVNELNKIYKKSCVSDVSNSCIGGESQESNDNSCLSTEENKICISREINKSCDCDQATPNSITGNIYLKSCLSQKTNEKSHISAETSFQRSSIPKKSFVCFDDNTSFHQIVTSPDESCYSELSNKSCTGDELTCSVNESNEMKQRISDKDSCISHESNAMDKEDDMPVVPAMDSQKSKVASQKSVISDVSDENPKKSFSSNESKITFRKSHASDASDENSQKSFLPDKSKAISPKAYPKKSHISDISLKSFPTDESIVTSQKSDTSDVSDVTSLDVMPDGSNSCTNDLSGQKSIKSVTPEEPKAHTNNVSNPNSQKSFTSDEPEAHENDVSGQNSAKSSTPDEVISQKSHESDVSDQNSSKSRTPDDNSKVNFQKSCTSYVSAENTQKSRMSDESKGISQKSSHVLNENSQKSGILDQSKVTSSTCHVSAKKPCTPDESNVIYQKSCSFDVSEKNLQKFDMPDNSKVIAQKSCAADLSNKNHQKLPMPNKSQTYDSNEMYQTGSVPVETNKSCQTRCTLEQTSSLKHISANLDRSSKTRESDESNKSNQKFVSFKNACNSVDKIKRKFDETKESDQKSCIGNRKDGSCYEISDGISESYRTFCREDTTGGIAEKDYKLINTGESNDDYGGCSEEANGSYSGVRKRYLQSCREGVNKMASKMCKSESSAQILQEENEILKENFDQLRKSYEETKNRLTEVESKCSKMEIEMASKMKSQTTYNSVDEINKMDKPSNNADVSEGIEQDGSCDCEMSSSNSFSQDARNADKLKHSKTSKSDDNDQSTSLPLEQQENGESQNTFSSQNQENEELTECADELMPNEHGGSSSTRTQDETLQLDKSSCDLEAKECSLISTMATIGNEAVESCELEHGISSSKSQLKSRSRSKSNESSSSGSAKKGEEVDQPGECGCDEEREELESSNKSSSRTEQEEIEGVAQNSSKELKSTNASKSEHSSSKLIKEDDQLKTCSNISSNALDNAKYSKSISSKVIQDENKTKIRTCTGELISPDPTNICKCCQQFCSTIKENTSLRTCSNALMPSNTLQANKCGIHESNKYSEELQLNIVNIERQVDYKEKVNELKKCCDDLSSCNLGKINKTFQRPSRPTQEDKDLLEKCSGKISSVQTREEQTKTCDQLNGASKLDKNNPIYKNSPSCQGAKHYKTSSSCLNRDEQEVLKLTMDYLKKSSAEIKTLECKSSEISNTDKNKNYIPCQTFSNKPDKIYKTCSTITQYEEKQQKGIEDEINRTTSTNSKDSESKQQDVVSDDLKNKSSLSSKQNESESDDEMSETSSSSAEMGMADCNCNNGKITHPNEQSGRGRSSDVNEVIENTDSSYKQKEHDMNESLAQCKCNSINDERNENPVKGDDCDNISDDTSINECGCHESNSDECNINSSNLNSKHKSITDNPPFNVSNLKNDECRRTKGTQVTNVTDSKHSDEISECCECGSNPKEIRRSCSETGVLMKTCSLGVIQNKKINISDKNNCKKINTCEDTYFSDEDETWSNDSSSSCSMLEETESVKRILVKIKHCEKKHSELNLKCSDMKTKVNLKRKENCKLQKELRDLKAQLSKLIENLENEMNEAKKCYIENDCNTEEIQFPTSLIEYKDISELTVPDFSKMLTTTKKQFTVPEVSKILDTVGKQDLVKLTLPDFSKIVETNANISDWKNNEHLMKSSFAVEINNIIKAIESGDAPEIEEDNALEDICESVQKCFDKNKISYEQLQWENERLLNLGEEDKIAGYLEGFKEHEELQYNVRRVSAISDDIEINEDEKLNRKSTSNKRISSRNSMDSGRRSRNVSSSRQEKNDDDDVASKRITNASVKEAELLNKKMRDSTFRKSRPSYPQESRRSTKVELIGKKVGIPQISKESLQQDNYFIDEQQNDNLKQSMLSQSFYVEDPIYTPKKSSTVHQKEYLEERSSSAESNMKKYIQDYVERKMNAAEKNYKISIYVEEILIKEICDKCIKEIINTIRAGKVDNCENVTLSNSEDLKEWLIEAFTRMYQEVLEIKKRDENIINQFRAEIFEFKKKSFIAEFCQEYKCDNNFDDVRNCEVSVFGGKSIKDERSNNSKINEEFRSQRLFTDEEWRRMKSISSNIDIDKIFSDEGSLHESNPKIESFAHEEDRKERPSSSFNNNVKIFPNSTDESAMRKNKSFGVNFNTNVQQFSNYKLHDDSSHSISNDIESLERFKASENNKFIPNDDIRKKGISTVYNKADFGRYNSEDFDESEIYSNDVDEDFRNSSFSNSNQINFKQQDTFYSDYNTKQKRKSQIPPTGFNINDFESCKCESFGTEGFRKPTKEDFERYESFRKSTMGRDLYKSRPSAYDKDNIQKYEREEEYFRNARPSSYEKDNFESYRYDKGGISKSRPSSFDKEDFERYRNGEEASRQSRFERFKSEEERFRKSRPSDFDKENFERYNNEEESFSKSRPTSEEGRFRKSRPSAFDKEYAERYTSEEEIFSKSRPKSEENRFRKSRPNDKEYFESYKNEDEVFRKSRSNSSDKDKFRSQKESRNFDKDNFERYENEDKRFRKSDSFNNYEEDFHKPHPTSYKEDNFKGSRTQERKSRPTSSEEDNFRSNRSQERKSRSTSSDNTGRYKSEEFVRNSSSRDENQRNKLSENDDQNKSKLYESRNSKSSSNDLEDETCESEFRKAKCDECAKIIKKYKCEECGGTKRSYKSDKRYLQDDGYNDDDSNNFRRSELSENKYSIRNNSEDYLEDEDSVDENSVKYKSGEYASTDEREEYNESSKLSVIEEEGVNDDVNSKVKEYSLPSNCRGSRPSDIKTRNCLNRSNCKHAQENKFIECCNKHNYQSKFLVEQKCCHGQSHPGERNEENLNKNSLKRYCKNKDNFNEDQSMPSEDKTPRTKGLNKNNCNKNCFIDDAYQQSFQQGKSSDSEKNYSRDKHCSENSNKNNCQQTNCVPSKSLPNISLKESSSEIDENNLSKSDSKEECTSMENNSKEDLNTKSSRSKKRKSKENFIVYHFKEELNKNNFGEYFNENKTEDNINEDVQNFRSNISLKNHVEALEKECKSKIETIKILKKEIDIYEDYQEKYLSENKIKGKLIEELKEDIKRLSMIVKENEEPRRKLTDEENLKFEIEENVGLTFTSCHSSVEHELKADTENMIPKNIILTEIEKIERILNGAEKLKDIIIDRREYWKDLNKIEELNNTDDLKHTGQSSEANAKNDTENFEKNELIMSLLYPDKEEIQQLKKVKDMQVYVVKQDGNNVEQLKALIAAEKEENVKNLKNIEELKAVIAAEKEENAKLLNNIDELIYKVEEKQNCQDLNDENSQYLQDVEKQKATIAAEKPIEDLKALLKEDNTHQDLQIEDTKAPNLVVVLEDENSGEIIEGLDENYIYQIEELKSLIAAEKEVNLKHTRNIEELTTIIESEKDVNLKHMRKIKTLEAEKEEHSNDIQSSNKNVEKQESLHDIEDLKALINTQKGEILHHLKEIENLKIAIKVEQENNLKHMKNIENVSSSNDAQNKENLEQEIQNLKTLIEVERNENVKHLKEIENLKAVIKAEIENNFQNLKTIEDLQSQVNAEKKANLKMYDECETIVSVEKEENVKMLKNNEDLKALIEVEKDEHLKTLKKNEELETLVNIEKEEKAKILKNYEDLKGENEEKLKTLRSNEDLNVEKEKLVKDNEDLKSLIKVEKEVHLKSIDALEALIKSEKCKNVKHCETIASLNALIETEKAENVKHLQTIEDFKTFENKEICNLEKKLSNNVETISNLLTKVDTLKKQLDYYKNFEDFSELKVQSEIQSKIINQLKIEVDEYKELNCRYQKSIQDCKNECVYKGKIIDELENHLRFFETQLKTEISELKKMDPNRKDNLIIAELKSEICELKQREKCLKLTILELKRENVQLLDGKKIEECEAENLRLKISELEKAIVELKIESRDEVAEPPCVECLETIIFKLRKENDELNRLNKNGQNVECLQTTISELRKENDELKKLNRNEGNVEALMKSTVQASASESRKESTELDNLNRIEGIVEVLKSTVCELRNENEELKKLNRNVGNVKSTVQAFASESRKESTELENLNRIELIVEVLKSTVGELRNENEELKKSDKNKKCEYLESSISELRKEIDELRKASKGDNCNPTNVECLKLTIADLRCEIIELKNTNRNECLESKNLKSKVLELIHEIVKLKNVGEKVQCLKSTISELDKMKSVDGNECLESLIAELKREIIELKNCCCLEADSAKVEYLKSTIKELQEESTELKIENNELKNCKVKSLEATIEELRKEICEVNKVDEFDSAEVAILKLTEENDALRKLVKNANILELKEDNRRLRENIKMVTNLKDKYHDMIQKYSQQNSELEKQNTFMMENIRVIEEYKKKLLEKDKVIKDMRRNSEVLSEKNNVGSGENIVEGLKDELLGKEKVICELELQINQLEEKYSSICLKSNEENKLIDDYKQKMYEKDYVISELKSEINKCNGYKKKIFEKERELNEYINELEDIKEELNKSHGCAQKEKVITELKAEINNLKKELLDKEMIIMELKCEGNKLSKHKNEYSQIMMELKIEINDLKQELVDKEMELKSTVNNYKNQRKELCEKERITNELKAEINNCNNSNELLVLDLNHCKQALLVNEHLIEELKCELNKLHANKKELEEKESIISDLEYEFHEISTCLKEDYSKLSCEHENVILEYENYKKVTISELQGKDSIISELQMKISNLENLKIEESENVILRKNRCIVDDYKVKFAEKESVISQLKCELKELNEIKNKHILLEEKYASLCSEKDRLCCELINVKNELRAEKNALRNEVVKCKKELCQMKELIKCEIVKHKNDLRETEVFINSELIKYKKELCEKDKFIECEIGKHKHELQKKDEMFKFEITKRNNELKEKECELNKCHRELCTKNETNAKLHSQNLKLTCEHTELQKKFSKWMNEIQALQKIFKTYNNNNQMTISCVGKNEMVEQLRKDCEKCKACFKYIHERIEKFLHEEGNQLRYYCDSVVPQCTCSELSDIEELSEDEKACVTFKIEEESKKCKMRPDGDEKEMHSLMLQKYKRGQDNNSQFVPIFTAIIINKIVFLLLRYKYVGVKRLQTRKFNRYRYWKLRQKCRRQNLCRVEVIKENLVQEELSSLEENSALQMSCSDHVLYCLANGLTIKQAFTPKQKVPNRGNLYLTGRIFARHNWKPKRPRRKYNFNALITEFLSDQVVFCEAKSICNK